MSPKKAADNSASKRRRIEQDEPAHKRSRTQSDNDISSSSSSSSSESPRHVARKGDRTTASRQECLQMRSETGDIFDAPSQALLIHACNCEGSWGAGIAKAFKQHYPKAFLQYQAYCKEHGHKLIGTALLIPPHEDENHKHFIGCLFTSRSKGRTRDKPNQILDATVPAVENLLQKVDEWNTQRKGEEAVGEARICKINSGLFAVPWDQTRAALASIDVKKASIKSLRVISRAE